MERIVIIGAGHGGTQAAASLREEGFQGEIVLISEESDLPYHKPPLSKSFMTSPDAPLQALRAAPFFADQRITLRLGTGVSAIDRERQAVILAQGEVLTYDRLILAMGTRARRLTAPGAMLEGVFHLRTAEDARAMRAGLPQAGHVVVIGGGFIGLEAAAMLAARGLSVAVVELAPRLLGRAVSSPTAGAVAAYLEGLGVHVLCTTGIEALVGKGGRIAGVALSTGETLPADLVVVGIGAVPAVELAEAAGLAVQNGIRVDSYLTTSDPLISAIGDCAAFPHYRGGATIRLESVQNATDQARALAKTLTGRPEAYAALPWFWSDIGELKLQIAGLGDSDEDLCAVDPDTAAHLVWRLSNGQVVSLETLNGPSTHMLARRMIADGFSPERAVMEAGTLDGLKAAYRARQSEPAKA